jgi:hypothetical protein
MNVSHPKLTLFAFHLRNNFSQEQPVEDANSLWEQCQHLGERLKIPRLQSLLDRLYTENGAVGVNPAHPNSNYLELLQLEPLLKFSAIPDGSTLQLRGEVYPLQIHDTYAVDITLRFPDFQIELEQLKNLNPHGCLRFDRTRSLLGQTLIFFAKLDDRPDNIQSFADECLISILPEHDRDRYKLSTQGKFLGSPIFEYQPIGDSSETSNSIIIWLNESPQTEALESEGSYYQPLINLLCCYRKIEYVYAESRRCHEKARSIYRDLAAQLQAFRQLSVDRNSRLQQLKTWLLTLPQMALDYADLLRDLELHRVAIVTNSQNHQFWFDRIKTIASPEDDLKLWETAISEFKIRIQQIQTDISYLQPNQSLFQQAIDTIRGTVEIEQAEIDRANEEAAEKRQAQLETLIFAVSTGLAISGISSQVIGEPTRILLTRKLPETDKLLNTTQYWLYGTGDVFFHLAIGIISALLAGLVLHKLRKS